MRSTRRGVSLELLLEERNGLESCTIAAPGYWVKYAFHYARQVYASHETLFGREGRYSEMEILAEVDESLRGTEAGRKAIE
jgi:hypothetical protein